MASVLTLEAKLERVDPTTPWGFRMQGGKEFGIPLTILKVRIPICYSSSRTHPQQTPALTPVNFYA